MEANYKKKLLSMFLVLVLCLSMIPTSAMAEEAAGGSAAAGQEELTTGDPQVQRHHLSVYLSMRRRVSPIPKT